MWSSSFRRAFGPALVLLWAASAHGAPVAWQEAPFLRQLVARANAEHRMVLVRVGRRFCVDCVRIDRTLADSSLATALGELLRARYDAGSGEGQDVARRYNVVRYPTLLVLGPDGLERGRVGGAPDAAELARRLAAIRRESLTQLGQRAAKHADDLGLALRVGLAWAERGQRRPAERHLRRVIAAGERDGAAPALLALGDLLYLRSLGAAKQASSALRELRQRFPGTAAARQARLPLALALAARGQAAAAQSLLAGEPLLMGRFCLERGEGLGQGLQQVDRALKRDPGSAEAWGLKAALLQARGLHRQAGQAWTRARKLAR